MTVYPPLWAYGDRRWNAPETGAGTGTGAGDSASPSPSSTVLDPSSSPSPSPARDPNTHDPMEPSYGITYARRYWCLFMLTVSSALQTMTWMTYATTTDQIQERYGWSSFQINLLTTWGPAFYVPVSLIVSWYDQRFGVRAGVTLCMTLTCIGSILRIIAPVDSVWALPLAHIGSIVNAIGAPFTKATPSSLSMIWFPSHQRTASTAIGSIAPYMGIAIGFLLTLTVKTGKDLSQLLIIEAIITSIFALLQICDHTFPSIPPSPPSYSQYLITVSNQVDTVASGTGTGTDTDYHIHLSWIGQCRYKLGVWIRKTIIIFSNTSFLIIVCVYGLSNGVYTGWSGILYLILKPLDFTQDQAAWLGFGLTSTGIIGACMISPMITFMYPQIHMQKQQQQQQAHTHTHAQQQFQAVTSTSNPDGPNDYFPSTSTSACSPSLSVDPTITIPSNGDDDPHAHDLHDGGISARTHVHDYHQSSSTSTNQLDDTIVSNSNNNAHFIDTNDMDRVQRNPVLSHQHIVSDAEEPIASSLPSSSLFSSSSSSTSSSHGRFWSRSRSRPSNRSILLFLFATTSLLFLFYTLQANQYYHIHFSILYILILAASMLVCATIPLSYESCVDSLYPGSATLANAISSSSSHIIQSIFILSQNIFSSYVLNWILTSSTILSFILLYIWKEKLTRQTLDETHATNNIKHTHTHIHTHTHTDQTPNITHNTNTYYSSTGLE